MRSSVLVLASALSVLLIVGCSEPNVQEDEAKRENASKTPQAATVQQKTVVVNEGMSKEEEEELNERVAELEDKVEKESTKQQKTNEQGANEQEAESAEDQASEAAQDYYAAAAAGNYTYTYDALASNSQVRFTEEQWVAANTALGSDEASYDIYSTEMVDDTTATVGLTVIAADGSADDRTTLFVSENGEWKHELSQAEYDLFAGATASASASATASASASANGSPDPSPNRNAPDPNVPSPEGGGCEPPAYPVPPGDDRDGDGDGCAGET